MYNKIRDKSLILYIMGVVLAIVLAVICIKFLGVLGLPIRGVLPSLLCLWFAVSLTISTVYLHAKVKSDIFDYEDSDFYKKWKREIVFRSVLAVILYCVGGYMMGACIVELIKELARPL